MNITKREISIVARPTLYPFTRKTLLKPKELFLGKHYFQCGSPALNPTNFKSPTLGEIYYRVYGTPEEMIFVPYREAPARPRNGLSLYKEDGQFFTPQQVQNAIDNKLYRAKAPDQMKQTPHEN